MPESNKDEIKKTLEVNVSMRDIETEGDVIGAKIKNIRQGNVNVGMEKIKAKGDVKGQEVDNIG